MGPADRLPRNGALAGNNPPGNNPAGKVEGPAGRPSATGATADVIRETQALVSAVANKTAGELRKLWNETFERAVTNPGLVIDTCDVLFQMSEFQHAAEALKATLPQGPRQRRLGTRGPGHCPAAVRPQRPKSNRPSCRPWTWIRMIRRRT